MDKITYSGNFGQAVETNYQLRGHYEKASRSLILYVLIEKNLNGGTQPDLDTSVATGIVRRIRAKDFPDIPMEYVKFFLISPAMPGVSATATQWQVSTQIRRKFLIKKHIELHVTSCFGEVSSRDSNLILSLYGEDTPDAPC